jgi:phospholipid transport system substrate-binding protein
MGMRRFSVLILLTLLAGVSIGPSRAEDPGTSDAASFVNRVVVSALHTLGDRTITDAEREQRTASLLRQDFDVSLISRYVLGRYSATASADDLRTFDGLFVEWIVRSYSPPLRNHVADDIKLTTAPLEGSKDSVVTTEFRTPGGGPANKIEWRVGARDGGYKIIDVAIEGVSMLVTGRDEVAAIAQRSGGTVAGLNGQLDLKLHTGTVASGASSGL